ncbi:hypothetical protein JXA80_09890 [bacterium]|nr:hypothetical protein [candidate division CSSED10-310 bacterium]
MHGNIYLNELFITIIFVLGELIEKGGLVRIITSHVALLFIVLTMCSPVYSGQEAYISGTSIIERVHKGMDNLNVNGDTHWIRAALDARPPSIGYVESTRYLIRSHYPAVEWIERAETILHIVETSWDRQVLEMGFPPPPPDCGNGGSDHLDIYLQDLPQGIGGYAAFSCYLDDTPAADAASFIAMSLAVGDTMLRSAVTHEFNHVLQNAIDYWETIAFKENTATWVMDRMYDDENYYFNYLRSYQRNPDWPIHKFSTTNTYQYGGCMWVHFLAEYYGGGDPSVVVDLWQAGVQDQLHNEPDYIDALQEVIPRVSGGADTFHDALAEYAVWRTITGERDDGCHFHDGGQWSAGADVLIDTTVDLALGLPAPVSPNNEPFDYGFSYVRILNPQSVSGAVAVEFRGDPAVEWSASLIQSTDALTTHRVRRFDLTHGSGILLLNPAMLQAAEELTIAVVNLSDASFDPDTGVDGTRRAYSLRFFTAQPDTALGLWPDSPMTCPGSRFGLTREIAYYGPAGSIDFWVFIEIAGLFFSLFTNPEGIPQPQTISVQPGDSITGSILDFTMPTFDSAIPLIWHAGLLQGPLLLDYQTARCNLVTSCR